MWNDVESISNVMESMWNVMDSILDVCGIHVESYGFHVECHGIHGRCVWNPWGNVWNPWGNVWNPCGDLWNRTIPPGIHLECGGRVNYCLFGFMQMNCAHDGQTLGQALYTICQRLNIVSKVTWISSSTVFIFLIIFQIGHITCDNASNNETMLQEFAWCYHFKTGVKFDIKHWHIRWPSNWPLTITTTIIAQCPPQMPCPYSQPRHASIDCQPKFFQLLYSRHNQRRHHRREFQWMRWSWSCVHNLCQGTVIFSSLPVFVFWFWNFQAHSSAQRKQLFLSIQEDLSVDPWQLLLDMKVQWGSTYVMLRRALTRRQACTYSRIFCICFKLTVSPLGCQWFCYETRNKEGRREVPQAHRFELD